MSTNIVSFLPAGQFKSKGPHELAGPCPQCGGQDRFIVRPNEGATGRYFCRQCGAKGDGIQYLRDFEGYSFAAACEAVGADHARRVKSGGVTKREVVATETQAPARVEYPGPEWQATAQAFLSSCRVEPVRGLTVETCRACGIFVNPADRWPERTAWGLENYTDKDGREHTKTLLPRGIVIATRRKAGLVGGTIRCPDEDITSKGRPKFKDLPGGAQVPFFAGRAGVPVVLVESAIDAALVWQSSGGRLAGVALMGATKEPDADTDAFLRAAPALIAVPDFDAAGMKGGRRWFERYPAAIYFPPIEGKDLGERPDWCPLWCELAIEEVGKKASAGDECADRGADFAPMGTRPTEFSFLSPDMLDGWPVCYLPQETPERLRGIMPPDLRGLGVPIQGLPLSLRGISACGWTLEEKDGRLELQKARVNARNEEGVRGYLRLHYASIYEGFNLMKRQNGAEV